MGCGFAFLKETVVTAIATTTTTSTFHHHTPPPSLQDRFSNYVQDVCGWMYRRPRFLVLLGDCSCCADAPKQTGWLQNWSYAFSPRTIDQDHQLHHRTTLFKCGFGFISSWATAKMWLQCAKPLLPSWHPLFLSCWTGLRSTWLGFVYNFYPNIHTNTRTHIQVEFLLCAYFQNDYKISRSRKNIQDFKTSWLVCLGWTFLKKIFPSCL